MRQYTDLLRKILEKGRLKKNRTGVDVLSLIGPQMEFDLSDGFPLLTERPIFFRGVVGENLWFLDGECNNEALLAEGIKIWDKWALKEDRTARMARDLPELVEALFQKRNQDVPVGDEPVITRQQIQEELQAAEIVDNQQGLPTLIDRKNATGPEEMMGGFRIMRDEGIELYADKLLLPKGYLGPIYGVLWRQWLTHDGRAVDQVQTIFDKLASDNPKLRYSRANIITAFNPGVLPDETVNAETNILNGKQALAACHTMFQLFAEPLTVEERINLVNASLPDWEHAREMLRKLNDPDSTPEAFTRTWFEALDADAQQKILDQLDELKVPKDRLSLKLYQRSADFPVGVPFNIAGYALLTHMFAHQLNMQPGLFIHTFGDAHIYVDQIDGVKELLARVDNPDIEVPALPRLIIKTEAKTMFDYKVSDFILEGYEPLKPQIKFPVAE